MILERIRQAYPRLTKSQKLLADLVAASYHEVAFMTASALAQRLSLNEATVIRFAQRLGYPGFPEMIRDVQELVHRELTADTAADASAPAEAPFFAALRANMESTQRALGHIAPDTIEVAIGLLQNAGAIAVTGEGLAGLLAGYLALSLRSVGRPADHLDSDVLSLALWLDRLPADALLVGISLTTAEGPGVPNALHQAQTRGAATLALAASPLSACAQSANLALTCLAGGDAQGIPCLAAVASLIEALTATLAGAQQPPATTGALWQHARDLLQPPKR